MDLNFQDDVSTFTGSHKIWEQNKDQFYDFVHEQTIGRSLTCQWVDDSSLEGNDKQYVILGEDQKKKYELSAYKVDMGKGGQNQLPFKKVFKESFDKEIHRAIHQPGNPHVIAAIQESGNIIIIQANYTDENFDGQRTTITTRGHDQEGYGLSWNPNNPAQLLSAAYDNKIFLWDAFESNTQLQKVQIFQDHHKEVEDVEWSPFHSNVFGSVSDDKTLKLFDIRSKKCTRDIIAHSEEINSISFNPFNEHILITGSSDTIVGLWDLRNTKRRMYSFISHSKPVYKVCFNKKQKNIFASSSDDKKIVLWDISKIGEEQIGRDSDIGPPEMIFIHRGHKKIIRDLCWYPYAKWSMVSVDDNYINQVWKVKSDILEYDPELEFSKIFDQL
ncbi:histone-binding protein msi1 [Anaeramoeba flamelloides]|uniref:Histone-binding protein msi1 n=1 Tax=Anaeramoeba flamelloides TaxID=1746091 RepID=A0AAV7Z8H2_9EUKA|nr:histone-binding protein msi1 [Anaeramoeba flamelloides]